MISRSALLPGASCAVSVSTSGCWAAPAPCLDWGGRSGPGASQLLSVDRPAGGSACPERRSTESAIVTACEASSAPPGWGDSWASGGALCLPPDPAVLAWKRAPQLLWAPSLPSGWDSCRSVPTLYCGRQAQCCSPAPGNREERCAITAPVADGYLHSQIQHTRVIMRKVNAERALLRLLMPQRTSLHQLMHLFRAPAGVREAGAALGHSGSQAILVQRHRLLVAAPRLLRHRLQLQRHFSLLTLRHRPMPGRGRCPSINASEHAEIGSRSHWQPG